MIGVRPIEESSKDQFLAQWRAILDDPNLQDLPYRVETDQWGYIRLSPITNLQSRYATHIAVELESRVHDGEALPNGVVLTSEGIRVPNVVWSSHERLEDSEEVFLIAPELCVEVASRSINPQEMNVKAQLYFAAGALEVWTCDLEGHMKFTDPDGVLEQSKLVPEFPSRVELKGRQPKV